MLDRDSLLTLFDVTVRSLVFNLDFIPADKLEWKPAPEAKSALEIVNHLAEFLDSISGRINAQPSEVTAATNTDEAKAALTQAAGSFAAAVRGASSATLELKFSKDHPFTIAWIVTAAIMDSIHHHGQIAYLQTLLGDTEIHFDPSSLADFAIR
jgi:uncharacterized damage-inducible protein DinB